MKILFYQHQYPAFGGIETVTTHLARTFALDGHDVRIVSFVSKPGTNLLSQLPPTVKWIPLPEAALDSPTNRKALRSVLDEFAPDEIVFQDSYANIHTMLFDVVRSWRSGSPLALQTVEHSSPEIRRTRAQFEDTWPFRVLKRILLVLLAPYFRSRRKCAERSRRRVLLRNSDRYVTLSPAYSRIVRDLVGARYADGKLLDIPNPTVRTGLPYRPEEKRKELLFVGSLIKTKGVSRILSAWRRISASRPDWELVIVGDGPERPALEDTVAKRRIPRVRFEGFSSSPERHYETASIFVMASDFEGFPMVLGEAMSHGVVPVIYDSFAAASEIVSSGVAGFAIPAFRQRKFCAKVEELMADKALLRHHAEFCVKRAHDFSIETVKKAWYAQFSTLGGGVIIVEHNEPRY